MALKSTLNKNTISLVGGSGNGKNASPTYGSYVAGGSSSPSMPSPVTPPSYSNLTGQSPSYMTPVGNTVQMPSASFNSNVQHIGAAQSKGNGGVTDEGLIIGGGATPLPQINQGGSSRAEASNPSSAATYGSWLKNAYGKVTGAVGSIASGVQQWLSKQNASGKSNEKTAGATDEGTSATKEQGTYSGAWSSSEPVDSYEEFLRNKEDAYASMRDEQTKFYDEQSKKTLDAIEEQHQAALAEAENQKNLLINMSEEQKNAIYKFAEEQRISDLDYAAKQYQLLLDSINAQKESGMKMATEQRELLLKMSEEQRDAIYTAAENQRVAAEQRADVERERGVVDARSSYEQNKASYGANAEAMGSMGLSGSGYSDYLNTKAYAQQRAETQAANAQADASKREARYAEDQARLQADSDYYQNKYNAEQAYSDRKYEIDTTYQTNLLGANQNKAQAEHEATSAERESKFNADQAHTQNAYAAESGYSQSKHEADSQARSDKLGAEQSADAGKFSAEMSYQENLLNNDDAIGKYRQEQAAEAEEKASYARAAYTELLSGANSGAYTAAQLEQLAADYGLSDVQKQSLINAANDYTAKKQAATNSEISSNTGDMAGTVQSAIDSGSISKEQGQEHIYNNYKDEIASGSADTGAIDAAYNKGQISEAQYNDLKNRWNDNIETTSDFFYSNGTMLNKSAAKQALDNLTKQSWLSQANKSAITAIYNSLYSPVTKSVSFNNDGGWWIFGSTDTGAKGNNFSVKTSDGTIYRVEYGGEETDTNIKEIGSSVGDGQVFGYQEKLYIKQNGKIYIVQERSNSYGSHYDALYNIFFGNGDPTSIQSANNAGSSAKSQTQSAAQQIQSFIDSNGLREGDRNRWGQAFKSAGLLDLYNTLTAEEKAALKGKT